MQVAFGPTISRHRGCKGWHIACPLTWFEAMEAFRGTCWSCLAENVKRDPEVPRCRSKRWKNLYDETGDDVDSSCSKYSMCNVFLNVFSGWLDSARSHIRIYNLSVVLRQDFWYSCCCIYWPGVISSPKPCFVCCCCLWQSMVSSCPLCNGPSAKGMPVASNTSWRRMKKITKAIHMMMSWGFSVKDLFLEVLKHVANSPRKANCQTKISKQHATTPLNMVHTSKEDYWLCV